MSSDGEVWIDPALAHLYGDAGPVDDDGEPVNLPVRETSLDELTNHQAGAEEFSDHDVTELALLVEEAQRTNTSSDEFLAELGLGEFYALEVEVTEPGGEPELEEDKLFGLNALGLAVTRRMAERAGLLPRGGATG